MRKISDIKVGYACNNDCIHCVIAGNRDELIKQKKPINRSFAECKKEILEAKDSGADEIVLTGGEPTIREDFLKLLNLINEESLKANIQTNGRAFGDTGFAGEVGSFHNIVFSIALHGPNKNVHDRITRKKGSFRETEKGIRNLMSLKKSINIKLVISKLNYKFLRKTIDRISDLNVKQINLTFPHGIGNAGKYFDEVVPKYTEIVTYVHEALEYCIQKGILFQTEAIPYCFLDGFEEWASEHFLIPVSQETRPVGLDTLDWSKKKPEIKRKAAQCDRCLFSKLCEGAWEEYIENYGEKEFDPVEITTQNMMRTLVKYKKIMDYRSGKIRIDRQNNCGESNKGE